MSSAMFKAAPFNSNFNNLHSSLRAALFHSTPFLQRKRRHSWDFRGNNHHSRRSRRKNGAKQRIIRNVHDYAEFLFQSWKDDINGDDPSSSRGTSWFGKQYSAGGFGKNRNGNQGSSNRYRRNPFFWENDFDVENILRSAFGGNRGFYWSFINEENPQWRRSERFSNHGKSWSWRHEDEDEYDSSSESDSSDSVRHRLALGLSASGPLKLEDVKIAYRACALKWHPDRHQGTSKAMAEEKFKLCSAAYQSLCDKLALD